MLGNIENSLKDFMACLQTARLYPDWHPGFKKAVDKAFYSLEAVLKDRPSLVLGIVGEELAFEKEIFFELSKIAKPVILHLKERGIERVEFLSGLQAEELGKFVNLLIVRKEEMKHGVQEELRLLGVKHIIAGKLMVEGLGGEPMKNQADVESVRKAVDYLSSYEESVGKVEDSLEKMLNQQEVDHLALRFTVDNVLENLVGRYQEFLNFATVKRYDQRTYSHIVNVSILSMYFASKLGFSREEVLEVGIAALFHDIGKLYISRKILKKPARLTDEEFAVIRSHVVVGAEILLRYVDTLGILPAVICFEHHLKYDLSGYPKVTYPKALHPVSLIVCICDVYDALSSRRNYKNDYPPKMIYDLMMKERGTTFEPRLLDIFFRIFGVWPVGTIVVLSNEKVAIVRKINEEDIFSPVVEVVAPVEPKGLLDLKGGQGEIKIERSLNPLSDGKEYLVFVSS
jgi:putative nucleotidyltransferase with HDIG domain